MADGSIQHTSGNNKRNTIKLVQSKKDRAQIEKYASFIKCQHIYTGRGYVQVSSGNNTLIPQIVNKFGFVPRKTYNPCRLVWIHGVRDDLFLSFLVGFIDGDGYIQRQSGGRVDAQIQVKVHGSWLKNLQMMSDRLHRISNVPATKVKIVIQRGGYVSVGRYALFIISNSIVLRMLKLTVKRLRLPAMERKWNMIDENYVSRQEVGHSRITRVIAMVRAGLPIKEMARRLKMSYHGAAMIINRNKIIGYQSRRKLSTVENSRRKSLVKKYIAKGWSFVRIAKVIKVDRVSVGKIAKEVTSSGV